MLGLEKNRYLFKPSISSLFRFAGFKYFINEESAFVIDLYDVFITDIIVENIQVYYYS